MRAPVTATRAELQETMGTVLKRAFRDPSYTLIFLGSSLAAISLPS